MRTTTIPENVISSLDLMWDAYRRGLAEKAEKPCGASTKARWVAYGFVVVALVYIKVDAGGGRAVATSTEFVFLPQQGKEDLLLATIDQPLINGTATGTSVTRYIHPDNLGSTAVTSDEVGNLAQSFNYAPFGSVLSSSNTGSTTISRQFIGQMTDGSGLSYLNARFYNSSQGQFLTEDPVFLGDLLQQNLTDPQSLNTYSYSENNPIVKKDPSGKSFQISYSRVVGNSAFSSGFQFDQNGIDFFTAGGSGYGASTGFEFLWTPNNNLPHTRQGSLEGFATAADGFGGSVSVPIASVQNGKRSKDDQATLGLVVGEGVSGGVEEKLSTPLWVWGNAPGLRGDPLQFIPNTYIGAPPKTSFNSSGGSSYASLNFGSNSQHSQVGPISTASQLGVGNNLGSFVGTYNFGSAGTYDFGASKWK